MGDVLDRYQAARARQRAADAVVEAAVAYCEASGAKQEDSLRESVRQLQELRARE